MGTIAKYDPAARCVLSVSQSVSVCKRVCALKNTSKQMEVLFEMETLVLSRKNTVPDRARHHHGGERGIIVRKNVPNKIFRKR